MDKKKIVFVLLGVIGVLLIAFGFQSIFSRKVSVNKSCKKLVSVIYSSNDNKKNTEEMIVLDGDRLILSSRISKSIGGFGDVKEYTVDKKNVDYVYWMIDKYSLVSLSKLSIDSKKLEDSNNSQTIVIRCKNNDKGEVETYLINYAMKLSNKQLKQLNKFVKYVSSLEKKSKMTRSYNEEEEMKKEFKEQENED